MSNIVSLSARRPAHDLPQQVALLATCFAQHRHPTEDVLWLKENAELLNVVESSCPQAGSALLDAYAPVHQSFDARFTYFPQYYRFLLAICLDLEDLGMPGTLGAALVDRTVTANLIGAELSDLQRAEGARLIARRGRSVNDSGLPDRLRAFCANSAPFAIPNKKACYELTHIVFYLSEYGRRDPDLPPEAETSLIFAGLMAQLDGNTDLLAEVCISLRFAGFDVPADWMAEVAADRGAYRITQDTQFRGDDYHAYLMTHWHGFLTGAQGFGGTIQLGSLRFQAGSRRVSALRDVSQALFGLGDARHADWRGMRAPLARLLTPEALARLDQCAQHPLFEAFFKGFARAPMATQRLVAVR